jgi:hypothetical protein
MTAYTDLQRVQLRGYMGMSKLFASSNAIFENVLNTIQGTIDDGSTFNQTVLILNQLLALDTRIATNSTLMLATNVTGEVVFDAIRADAGLRRIGRALINQLATIFSMKPSKDYYSAAEIDDTGTITLYGANQG